MKWILIVIFGINYTGATAAATAEFNTKIACETARSKIDVTFGDQKKWVRFFCTPKGEDTIHAEQ